MSDWGLPEGKDTIYAVGQDAKGQNFRMTDSFEKFNVDNLEKFTNEFKDGSLKPYIKSEAIPESNDGPVKV